MTAPLIPAEPHLILVQGSCSLASSLIGGTSGPPSPDCLPPLQPQRSSILRRNTSDGSLSGKGRPAALPSASGARLSDGSALIPADGRSQTLSMWQADAGDSVEIHMLPMGCRRSPRSAVSAAAGDEVHAAAGAEPAPPSLHPALLPFRAAAHR